MSAIDPESRINLSKATIIVIDGSRHSLDVIEQILNGCGVATVQRYRQLADANKTLNRKAIDLIIIDPSLEDGAGYTFIKDLRHTTGPNAFTPVILVSGHVKKANVAKARDMGVNFVVTKPLSSSVLLQRILWVARDKRSFVEAGVYIGPDRRFKFEGPPIASDGRRNSDLPAPLGDAVEPNISQDEVASLIEPRKVII